MLRRPPTSPLFPYTTLFRSQILMNDKPPAPLPFEQKGKGIFGDLLPRLHTVAVVLPAVLPDQFADLPFHPLAGFQQRSEEHTSELQSRENLVCRLLLEKKKL